MKKFSIEYVQIIDDEQILYRRTFSSFISLRDYIVTEFSTFSDLDSFDVRTFDTDYVATLPRLF